MRKSLFCLILLGSLCGDVGLCLGQDREANATPTSASITQQAAKDTKAQPKHLTVNGVTFDVPEEFVPSDNTSISSDTSVMLYRSDKMTPVFLIAPPKDLSQENLVNKVKRLAESQLTPTESQDYDWKSLPSSKKSKYETDATILLGFNQNSLIIIEYRQLLYQEKRILIGYYIHDQSPASALADRFQKGLGSYSILGWEAITSIIASITGEKFERGGGFIAGIPGGIPGGINGVASPPVSEPTVSLDKNSPIDGNLHYQVGGRAIAIPPPKGFVEVSTKLERLKNFFQTNDLPDSRLMAIHIPVELDEQIRHGAASKPSFYTKVSINKLAIGMNVSPTLFNRVIEQNVKAGDKILDPDSPETKLAVKNFEASMTEAPVQKSALGSYQTLNLGNFERTTDVYSSMVLMKLKVQVGNNQNEAVVLYAVSVLRIKERVLFVYTYRVFKSEDDLKILRDFTKTWTAEILAANTN